MKFIRRLKEGCTMPAWGIGWMDKHEYNYIVGNYYVLYISLGLGQRLRFTWQLIWMKENL